MNKAFKIILVSFMLLCGCQKQESYQSSYKQTNQTQKEDDLMEQRTLKINNQSFSIDLEDNETVQKFIELLPLTMDMQELNGNEKYYYMETSLPTNSENVGYIEAGDIMLFGDNCLVLFYKSFSTSYSYTRIGRMENVENLETYVGQQNITVTIE
ncbi:cyclophilin-like fold protein [Clostridium sp. AUH-JLR23]|jgi:hypothetical protein|uniref:cyclophilin-like fold protein n=1 Tax=Clostridium sp. AUH-JLR23 TaxID=1505062 RepID=UPI0035619B46